MITISPILIGGFGNRLYQIANIFRLQKHLNCKTKFYSINATDVDAANFRSLVLKPSDFDDFGGHSFTPIKELPSKITEVLPNIKWHQKPVTMNELLFGKFLYYENNVYTINTNHDAVIAGYFFSYSFVKNEIEDVKNIFNPKIFDYIRAKYQDLFTKNILGVHLRLGISTDNTQAVYIPNDFYQKIINDEIFNFDEVFIITDNPNKANDFIGNLDFKGKKVTIIDGEPMFVDLFILSFCKIISIAPSTLSAWSAYFSSNSKIYCPTIWTKHHWTNDIPTSWILM
jgi:hypothetical protein